MLNSLAHCCTCADRLKALQPGLKAAIISSSLLLTSRCLRSTLSSGGTCCGGGCATSLLPYRCDESGTGLRRDLFSSEVEGRALPVRMLDMRCNRCKEALAHTVIHLHCGYVMPNHGSKTIWGVTNPGGGGVRSSLGGGWNNARPLQAWQQSQGQDHLKSRHLTRYSSVYLT